MKFHHAGGVEDSAGRSPHGERGLKYTPTPVSSAAPGRSPHGERGLKSNDCVCAVRIRGSLPARGAWIEIVTLITERIISLVAPRTGSVD